MPYSKYQIGKIKLYREAAQRHLDAGRITLAARMLLRIEEVKAGLI